MTNICSNVPDSRSRTTAWDMIDMSEIMRIAATSPGIIVLIGSSVGLNTTRVRASIPGACSDPVNAAVREALKRAMACAAYPLPTLAICESDPSTTIPTGAVWPRARRSCVPCGMTSATFATPVSSNEVS